MQCGNQEKRFYSDPDVIPDKRVCLSQSFPFSPSSTLSTNATEHPSPWNIQPNGIPQSFIHKMEEEAYKYDYLYPTLINRQSLEYRNQSLIVYTPSTESIQSGPSNFSLPQVQSIPPIPSTGAGKEDEEDQDDEIGPVSYYYDAPMNESNFMEIVSSPEEDSSNGWGMSYHEQIMETGLRGMQPMSW